MSGQCDGRGAGEVVSRRGFLGRSAVLAAAPVLASAVAADDKPKSAGRKIKLGVVGCGGRGAWLTGLFQKHGGYVIHAVADYFPEVVNPAGDRSGVDPVRRFSGLSGYKKLLASGVEAVALETPPFFIPEHARAAVDAGLHVYMAKPVAVDVPGCLIIEAAAQKAGLQKRCFFVDYQAPTDPLNIEVVRRVKDGAVGRVCYLETRGFGSGFADPPRTATIESRLRNLVWVNDVALGSDYIGNYDIHAVDLALWVAGTRPVAATGASWIARANPHGDARDVCSATLEFPGGLVCNHSAQALPNKADGALSCTVYGDKGHALINYWGKAWVKGPAPYEGGEIQNLYEAGAVRNIATFYRDVTEDRTANPTVRRSVDGCLATILAREAAERKCRLTMDQLIKESRRLEVDLRGLKV